MAGRRVGRSIALQILYQADWAEDAEEAASDFARVAIEQYEKDLAPNGSEEDPELRRFVESLVTGVLSRRQALDEVIQRFSRKWKLQRMPAVDRNILRLGIFELCHVPDIPPRVAINEAVELAKRFGDANSPGFVNGILDSVFQEVCSKKLDGQHVVQSQGSRVA